MIGVPQSTLEISSAQPLFRPDINPLQTAAHARSSVRSAGAPLIPIAASFAIGILISNSFPPGLPTAGAVLVLAGVSGCWVHRAAQATGEQRSQASARVMLCVWFLTLGLARAELDRSPQQGDLASLIASNPEPGKVVGWIAEVDRDPLIDPQSDGSGRYELRCLQLNALPLIQDDGVLVTVSGPHVRLQGGACVQITGRIERPQTAGHRGQFDRREALRRRGIGALMRTSPSGVKPLSPADLQLTCWQHWSVGRARIVDEARRGFFRSVPAPGRALAVALFFGNRTALPATTNEGFQRSGVMHVLAISGLHVGLAGLFLEWVLKLLRLPRRWRHVLLIGLVIAYVLLTSCRPPVVRASVLLIVSRLGRLQLLNASLPNSLAGAALYVLIWDPAAVFDAGAQLSFLAVAGLIWSAPPNHTSSALAAAQLSRESWWSWIVHRLRTRVVPGCQQMTGLTLLTAPLIAHHFHIVSLVGLLLNPFVLAWMSVLLAIGFLTIPLAWISMGMSQLLGSLLSQGLVGMESVVSAVAAFDFSAVYHPGPSQMWVVIFYASWVAGLCLERRGFRKRLTLAMLAASTTLWISHGALEGESMSARSWLAEPEPLRCTFIDVGHGGATLLELPNGRTLLYDAGSLQAPYWTAQAVIDVLQAAGRERLDLVLLSHPDSDHCNAVPELLKRVEVGALLTSRQFFRDRPRVVQRVERAAEVYDVPIIWIQRGDRITLCPEVEIRIEHPGEHDQYESDNELSVVLAIAYASRRIGLVGDLEKAAQWELTDRMAGGFDLIQSPHHGSLNSNTSSFSRWADARFSIINGSQRTSRARLRNQCDRRTAWLNTYDTGAVSVEIDQRGELEVSTFRGGSVLTILPDGP